MTESGRLSAGIKAGDTVWYISRWGREIESFVVAKVTDKTVWESGGRTYRGKERLSRHEPDAVYVTKLDAFRADAAHADQELDAARKAFERAQNRASKAHGLVKQAAEATNDD